MRRVYEQPKPKARVVEGHLCPSCGANMISFDGLKMYCSAAGNDCEAKNKLFPINYKGL